MIWACFSTKGKSDLVFIEGTVNSTVYQQILNDELLKYIEKYFSGFEYIFQQDNAPCHTSKSTTNYLESNNINTMVWPPQSPDLNLIENLWAILKRKVARYHCNSLEDLKNTLKKVWNEEIDGEILNNLSKSFPKRINLVKKNKGRAINY